MSWLCAVVRRLFLRRDVGVNKRRGGKEPRSGAMTRMLGVLEIDSGCVFRRSMFQYFLMMWSKQFCGGP